MPNDQGPVNEPNYESMRNTRLAGTLDAQGVVTPTVNAVVSSGGATQPVSLASIPMPGSVSHAYTTVSVGVASASALASNVNAKYRMFQNLSTTATITIAASVTAVLNTQITLPPMAIYEMSLEAGNLDTRVFNAIASAAATTMLVTEGS